MPKLVDAADQRRAIRSAAREVFARRGLRGTGLAHVAAAAGMGRSSLYHYYPDKDALVRDLLRDVLTEEEALFAEVARGEGPPLERIEALTHRMVALFEPWAAAARLVTDLRSQLRSSFRPFFRRIRAQLAEAIAQGQRLGEIDRRVDPLLAAATLIGAVDGLLLQYTVEPGALADGEALARELSRCVRKGLAP
jgi:AcrR family transcriptional regulator